MCGAENTTFSLMELHLTGRDKYTGLPGRTNKLSINRTICMNLVKIVRNPATVDVTNRK